MNDKKYVVYKHLIDNEIFYIGCGKSSRPFDKYSRNNEWKEFTKNEKYNVEIVSYFDNKEDARKLESELIEQFRPPCNHNLNKDKTKEFTAKFRLPKDLWEEFKSAMKEENQSPSDFIRDYVTRCVEANEILDM